MDRGLARLPPVAEQAEVPCRRPARWMRIATCSVRATSFRIAPERKYTPCDAPKEKLWALRDFLGFERNVIVQATCHGADNRALVDALRASERPRARRRDCDARRHRRAVARAAMPRACAACASTSSSGWWTSTPREVLIEIAERIAPLGWHIVIYFEAQELPELYDFFASLPTTVVVDHMGRPDVTQPRRRRREFELFVKLMREHANFWSKVSGAGAPVEAPARRATTTSCRSRAASSRHFRIACCGAPTGRIRT